jgi:Tfp pilus assembly major pilin PilA
MTQIINTKYIGYNTLKTISEISIPLEPRHITNIIRQEIISYIKTNFINKTKGVNFILSIDTDSILHNELPLLKLNNSTHIYEYILKVPITYLYFTKNQIIMATLDIVEVNNNIKIIAYTKYLLCNILLDNNYNINLSEKIISYKNKEYKKDCECSIKIVDIFSSDGSNKIPCIGKIYDDKEIENNTI